MLSKKAVRLLNEPPLNQTLRRVLAGSTSARTGGPPRIHPININKDPTSKTFSRTEIVSEKLCDDILAYLAPTLRPYRGCTILDVHPGACLWSRKLHEFLRPKCHILMEPDELYTEDFITPLLKKSNSKYRHCKVPFVNDDNSWSYIHPYAQALDAVRGPGMRNLPTLTTTIRDYDDPRLRLLDANILMTGNLARVYSKKNPIHIVYREIQAALANSGLHRNGLVRQLWWLPDTLRNRVAMCPQVLTGRNGGTIMTALAADVTQVVGVDLSTETARESKFATSNHRVRNSQLDVENKRQVSSRMHVAGMYLPEGRSLLTHAPEKKAKEEERDDEEEEEEEHEAEDDDGKVAKAPESKIEEVVHMAEPKNPLLIHHHTFKEVSSAIDEFDTFLNTIRSASKQNWSNKSTIETLLQNIQYPQSLPAALESASQPNQRSRSAASHNITSLTQRKAIFLDIKLRLLSLETQIVSLRDDKEIPIVPLQTRLAKLDHEIKSKLSGGKLLIDAVQLLLEDQQLHFTTPTLNFMYDRRTYEPLLASKQEFWPKTPLALYEIVPKDTDLDVEDIAPRSEVFKLARELSKLLFQYRASPLPVALDRVAPNAAQDLIPKVPALTDPRKGGRLDPRNLGVRMVGEEMFEGLVRAWFEWPFKPERWELEVAGLGDRGLHGGGFGGGESSGGEEGERKE